MKKLAFSDLHAFDSKYSNLILAGVDEAGRGPWAGPVVAAAVILDKNKILTLTQINDSKIIPEDKREKLYDIVIAASLAYVIIEKSNEEIDSSDILKATLVAMKQAVEQLGIRPDIAIIDGNKVPVLEKCKAEFVIDGDARSLSIAAASILAKVHRDRVMREFDTQYPQYGFKRHKGYGTAEHMKALEIHGICAIHRKSYKPVKKHIK
ncbi:MAG: ribonuclease HII [bacterium]